MIDQLIKKRSGQSTIEYILLTTAVVVVVLIVVARNGAFHQAVNGTVYATPQMIQSVSSTVTFH
jgi:Flp pilus assembly pilin Flp